MDRLEGTVAADVRLAAAADTARRFDGHRRLVSQQVLSLRLPIYLLPLS